MIYRRQRQQYVFAIFLAVVVIVNLLFYFILTRPSQTEYATLQREIETLQKEAKNSETYLRSLTEAAGKLATFERDKNALLMMHLVQRNQGYSQIQFKLNSILSKSGVKYSSIRYNLNPDSVAGLNAVSIVVPVEGNYTNVVNFIRELENSDTFFLISQINLERTTVQEPVAGRPATIANNAASAGAVALSLTLETYFYQ
jgi:Tfp pilus assembly protein PilO